MGCSGKSDDISDLFRDPEPGPSQDVGFRQGTVVEFDPDTLENIVDVGGTLLGNLPILGSADASLYEPGAVVGIVPVGKATKTMYMVGRPRTATNPPSSPTAVVCTTGGPVKVCLRSDIAGRDRTLAGLVWALPGDDDTWDGTFDSSFMPAHLVGGVYEVTGGLYDDAGTIVFVDGQQRWGLPADVPPSGSTYIEDDQRITNWRYFQWGFRRTINDDDETNPDNSGNYIIGRSVVEVRVEESENMLEIFVERPGLYDSAFATITDDAQATYQFTADGLVVNGAPMVLGQQEVGLEEVSFTTQTSSTVAVSFAEEFSDIPVVMTNIASTDASTAGWISRAVNATTTGFDLYVSGASSSWTDIPVEWHAVI